MHDNAEPKKSNKELTVQLSANPNGSAYTTTETRKGVPLNYVGEKLRKAVEATHSNLKNIKSFVPNDLPAAPHFEDFAPKGIKNELLLSSAREPLQNSISSVIVLERV